MNKEIQVRTSVESAVEAALMQGDLSRLSTEQRLSYYKNLCESLGLNSLTSPFEYITLNGKLVLYAKKGCTDQLRNVYEISIPTVKIEYQGNLIIVTVTASNKSGRADSDIGVVDKNSMRGDVGNAIMKAVTKAKRRVTLSLCGLGMLDETEVETIPGAKVVRMSEISMQTEDTRGKYRYSLERLKHVSKGGVDILRWKDAVELYKVTKDSEVAYSSEEIPSWHAALIEMPPTTVVEDDTPEVFREEVIIADKMI